MNNNGSVSPELTPIVSDEVPAKRPPLILLLLMVVLLVLALYIGINVLGVLFGILSPPMPPFPEGFVEVRHVNEAYGADVWTFNTDQDACGVAVALQAEGVCQYSPLACGELRPIPNPYVPADLTVARCTGGEDFSIFNMHWWALVSRDENDDTNAVIEFEREIFWIGDGPQ